MKWITCGTAELPAVGAIFNDAILQTTSLYEYEPRSPESMQVWLAGKQAAGLPVIGLTDEEGQLLGFGTYGPFRSFPAYKHTVEHSVYVNPAHQGQGLGRQLLERLEQMAREAGYHMMIGVIDADNAASIALHQALGFANCGHIRHAGWKFDRWLDVVLYQKVLEEVG